MKTFDTHLAMKIVSQSTGGFSYDTLARAMIAKEKIYDPQLILESCRVFCLDLEERGIVKRCHKCSNSQDEYFQYIAH